ncbi:hypothetical protein NESM_000573800 [Novymonas esmeraldas]|uniref:Uncharacterized protein n=1 Tax=Novymonas esmeraldas TaxID=1808958 RepID=A0AAW0ETK6_9TRYP
MSFTLMACTDVRAQKVNIELPFDQPPATVEVLRAILERLFRQEEEAIKYAMGFTDTRPCEPFTINRLQRYDDDAQSWEDVTSIDALQTYDQLYVFRKNSTKADISTQRELPPPRMSDYFHDAATSASFLTPHVATRAREHSSGAAAAAAAAAVGATISPITGASAGASRARYDGSVSPLLARTSGGMGSSPYPTGSVGGAAAARASERYTGEDPYPASTALPVSGGTAAAAGGAAPPTPPPSSSSFYYKERTTPERVEYLFRLGSQPNGGAALTEKSFEHLFRMAGIAFPVEVLQDLFAHFATSGGAAVGGVAAMSEDRFQDFASNFPVLVNIAYQRLTNQDREEAIRTAQRETGKQVEHARRQLQELEARLAAARREAQQAEQRQARLQEDLHDLHQQRDPEYCQEEQKLLDKEVSVFRYRERLSREERDYERLAIERRKRAVAATARARSNSPQGTYDPNRYGPRD